MRLGVDSRYGMKIEMALDFWKLATEAGKKVVENEDLAK